MTAETTVFSQLFEDLPNQYPPSQHRKGTHTIVTPGCCTSILGKEALEAELQVADLCNEYALQLRIHEGKEFLGLFLVNATSTELPYPVFHPIMEFCEDEEGVQFYNLISRRAVTPEMDHVVSWLWGQICTRVFSETK
jgi:hypothetical protein